MADEKNITSSAFYFSLLFYILKLNYPSEFNNNIIEISTYLMIITTALFIFIYVNQLKLFYSASIGIVTFATLNLGVILAGTRGLSNDSPQVIDGLIRIVVAVFIIWKLSADMRNLKLQIDPFPPERSSIASALYGILYPPRELMRLIKVVLYILLSFYLISTGLNEINSMDVNVAFLNSTERISINVLFFGIQTPMMMASRASVSKTFSEYIKNLEWIESAFSEDQSSLSLSYQQILNAEEISYDSINSNGKHLWLTVLLVLLLQAFEQQITSLDIFTMDWLGIFGSLVDILVELFSTIL